MTRSDAIALADASFASGRFEDRLAQLVAIPSCSQDPALEPELERYLIGGIIPWLSGMGFRSEVHPNARGGGTILLLERIESPELPTVITYGHGDGVLGMDGEWSQGLVPWALQRRHDRWYGRGTADNKGQHVINLFALEAVLQARDGRLGFNVTLVLEMAEERGSIGLREFVQVNAQRLAADVFIASDGPRGSPGMPTIAAGSRGNYHFDLIVAPRKGGVHSGHWGGLTDDPAIVLSHALAAICDRNGRILVRDWLPEGGAPLPDRIRSMLEGCPLDPGTDAARIEPDWGEPALSPAEKLYAWNSFIVLSMLSGKSEQPMNAVAPDAIAHCQIRYVPGTDPEIIVPALRRHLDAAGFQDVRIENGRIGMPASAKPLPNEWVEFVARSFTESLGIPSQVIPQVSGGMPGDVFQDVLSVPLVWIPHGHNGCKQHGADEHLLIEVARQGVRGFAGLWWDLGERSGRVGLSAGARRFARPASG
ncbi:M20/M25/M40 family metallo-hydrolase [Xanthobacter dioxanivorans]|uniref:M20/M25/M40 family metallo-hydrolase n=1 Tax=Xanthobacter dioxanivorans TaxID=2528964 RepID=A0A974PPB5_9HYPH|nr:M20/M25/M40 family metallo-hydrolase [Xanthobacter dioxanivorans]QRG07288.1 M20/M25/M40 family metallo-hydrolase [Xanthobacter dioxanivorans]